MDSGEFVDVWSVIARRGFLHPLTRLGKGGILNYNGGAVAVGLMKYHLSSDLM